MEEVVEAETGFLVVEVCILQGSLPPGRILGARAALDRASNGFVAGVVIQVSPSIVLLDLLDCS